MAVQLRTLANQACFQMEGSELRGQVVNVQTSRVRLIHGAQSLEVHMAPVALVNVIERLEQMVPSVVGTAVVEPVRAPAGSMTMLDAAVRMLREARRPMRLVDLYMEMSSRGYWSSPRGRTPWATLSAAIGTEIRQRGPQSRFVKVDHGLYTVSSQEQPA